MARRLFLFIQLPGHTTSVVACSFSWDDVSGHPVGTFIYGQNYLGRRA